MNCIKTGINVYLEEYKAFVRCDAFLIGKSIVFNGMDESRWRYDGTSDDAEASTSIGNRGMFINGTLIVPQENVEWKPHIKEGFIENARRFGAPLPWEEA